MATFYNKATLSYNGITLSSNTATGELVSSLSIDKNSLTSTYNSESTQTYTVSLINSGSADFTNITLTDNLGAYTYGTNTVYPLSYVTGTVQYYQNGTIQTAPTVNAGPPLVITGITVPAGGNALIIYEAAVTTYAPPETGSSIVNTVTATGTGITENTSASNTITVQTTPYLNITKTVSPSSVVENGQVTYTFTIENYGNTAAVETYDVVVSDTFDPILNPITVTLNGTALSATTDYTYDSDTGVFNTVAGVITVPAASYTIDGTTGEYTITPGISILTVTGNFA